MTVSELKSYLDELGKYMTEVGGRTYIERVYCSIGNLLDVELKCGSLLSVTRNS